MSSTSTTPTWLKWLAPAAVFALVWWVFSPTLDAEFLYFDDDQVITSNWAFRGLDGEHLAWMFRASHFGHYQPLTWVSFAVDHALSGLDAGAFHRTNVLLHGLCAVAFFAFARLLFARALPGREATLAAAAAALLFAGHPLRAESVAWATERRDVLSGLFLMLGLGAWLRWVPSRPRATDEAGSSPVAGLAALGSALAVLALFFTSVELERGVRLTFSGLGLTGVALALPGLALCAWYAVRAAPRESTAPHAGSLWYWVALLCFLASLFAKAWGIVIPAVLLVLDVWPLGRLRATGTARGRAVLALVAEKLPFICLSVIFAALAAWAQATQIDTMKGLAEHSLTERIAQASYGLAWYPLKTLVPTGLAAIYELPDALPLSDPRFLVPLVGVLLLTALLWGTRRRAPALLTAWVTFGVVVSPVLGFAQSGPQLVADRYSYLSCMPFALLAGAALLILRPRALIGGVLVLAIGMYAFLGRQQAAVWHDSRTLWEHALAVRPESPMAMVMLAGEHQRRAGSEPDPVLQRQHLDRARELLEAGFELDSDPHFPSGLSVVHGSLAVLEPERASWHYAEATALARAALELADEQGSPSPHYRFIYGTALWNAGQLEDALRHFEWFARVRPTNPAGLVNLGRAHAVLGRPAQARPALERALELDPGNVEAWRALVGVYDALGKPARAREARRRLAALGG